MHHRRALTVWSVGGGTTTARPVRGSTTHLTLRSRRPYLWRKRLCGHVIVKRRSCDVTVDLMVTILTRSETGGRSTHPVAGFFRNGLGLLTWAVPVRARRGPGKGVWLGSGPCVGEQFLVSDQGIEPFVA